MDLNHEGVRSDDKTGAVIEGRYELLEMVGRGGSGVVYRAMDLNLQREVAVKLLSAECFNEPGQYERFERESLILRKLRAINTVFFYDTGRTDDGLPYIVMEFVTGIQLKKLLETEGKLPPERTVGILMQVFSSLQEAHELGFVHRDLKPANIMFLDRASGSGDFVKVLDFGVAKVVSEAEESSPTDEDARSEFVGTPRYMAPEQFRSEPVTTRSDLYSMGCVAYEMLTGISPFEGETLHVTIAKHLFMTPPPFGDDILQYPNLVAIVYKLLQKDPEKRFSTAQEVNDALAHWIEPEVLPELADVRFDEEGAENLDGMFEAAESGKTVPMTAPSASMIAALRAAQAGSQTASGPISINSATHSSADNVQHVAQSRKSEDLQASIRFLVILIAICAVIVTVTIIIIVNMLT